MQLLATRWPMPSLSLSCFLLGEFLLLNATVITNGKGLCLQAHFTCVFIAHLSWHILFGLSVTAVTWTVPMKVLSACFSGCPHNKGLSLSCTSSSSMAKTKGNHFFPDVRSVKMECCPEVTPLTSCVLGEFSWGPEHLHKREAVLLPPSRVLLGTASWAHP